MHRPRFRSFCSPPKDLYCKGREEAPLGHQSQVPRRVLFVAVPFLQCIDLLFSTLARRREGAAFFPTCIDAGRCSATFFPPHIKTFSLPFPRPSPGCPSTVAGGSHPSGPALHIHAFVIPTAGPLWSSRDSHFLLTVKMCSKKSQIYG